MKKLIFIVMVLTLIFSVGAVENPPSISDFEVFYGNVANIPATGGPYKVEVRDGIRSFRVNVVDNQYDNLKVWSTNGRLVRFYIVNNLGTAKDTNITARFQSGQITAKNLNYPVGSGVIVAAPTTTSNQTSTPGRRGGGGRDTDDAPSPTPPLSPDTCLMSWDCGLWNSCVSGVETRICRRSDSCDTKLAAGEIVRIQSVPKPTERRSCQVAAAPLTPSTVCQSGEKRCSGISLQQCAYDGSRWNTLETCSGGCDSLMLRCKVEVKPPVEEEPDFPWMWVILGVVAVLLIAGGVVGFVMIQKKKFAPGREYVEEQRGKGVSDSNIKSKLESQGWGSSDIEKLMK